MSKGKIRVVGVDGGYGIRRAGTLTLNHRKEIARLDGVSKSYKVPTDLIPDS